MSETCNNPPRLAGIVAATAEYTEKADSLARALRTRRLASAPTRGVYLNVGPEGLALCRPAPQRMCLLPAFDQGRQAHRGRHASPRREAVARACGLKGGTSPWVVDATAGLGRDAFILAGLGARVTLIERSPVVAALTRDALERARVEAATRETVERMELICAEATGYLEGLTGGAGPAAVYLDPMYPAAGRRANAKKDLQLLQALLGPPEAPEPLLGAALQIAADRVVVKRPLKGEALAGRPPAYSIRGRSTRFDVYLTGGKPGQS